MHTHVSYTQLLLGRDSKQYELYLMKLIQLGKEKSEDIRLQVGESACPFSASIDALSLSLFAILFYLYRQISDTWFF